MEAFIIVLIVIIAVLLGLVVLVQNPKGGGLAVGFQGSAQLGAQRTTDFLEKATWYLVIAMFVLSLASAAWYSTASTTEEGGEGPATENTEGTEGGDGAAEGENAGQ